MGKAGFTESFELIYCLSVCGTLLTSINDCFATIRECFDNFFVE